MTREYIVTSTSASVGPIVFTNGTTNFLREDGAMAAVPSGSGGGGDTFVDSNIQTTDATQTTVATYTTLNDQRTIDLALTVRGYQSSSADIIAYKMFTVAHRDAASTVTIKDIAILNGGFTTTGSVGWDIDVAVSASDILVKVTGEVSKVIEWRATGEVYEHG